MKPNSASSRSLSFLALSIALLLLLSGCLEKHLVWSPDGERAAVISKKGLHLSDAEGLLSPILVPDVYLAAWLGDSQQLVLAQENNAADWASIARILGREKASAIATAAESQWSKLEAGSPWISLGNDTNMKLQKAHLLEHHGEALRSKMSPGDWDAFKNESIAIHTLLMARIADGKIQLGTVLNEGLEKIEDIRIAASDRAIAFTTDVSPHVDKAGRLLVALPNKSGAQTVAENTSFFADWTADGRSLAYTQASSAVSSKDELRLGMLIQREVLDTEGHIKISEKPEELAGMVFAGTLRVRCLRDGRILFNAPEMTLPVAYKDAETERDRLWTIDSKHQATLVRMIPRGSEKAMPEMLTFFEPSPDDSQILVGDPDGKVSVLTLATGEVRTLQEKGDYSLMAAPVWRRAGELTYAKRNPRENGKQPERKAEIVLLKGDRETILSKTWSAELLEEIFPGQDKK